MREPPRRASRPGTAPGRPGSAGPTGYAPTAARRTAARHLFQERQLRSVTSNTRGDAREFLGFAAEHKLAVTVHPYPLDAADQALRDLKAGAFDGAAVLIP